MNIYKIEKEIIEKYTHTCTYASAHTYRIDRDSIDTREEGRWLFSSQRRRQTYKDWQGKKLFPFRKEKRIRFVFYKNRKFDVSSKGRGHHATFEQ